jgi:UDP-N-acetylglucosamine 2-epimerase (non-hydrolysing)
MEGQGEAVERLPALVVLGTRPEAIKLAPIILALQNHPRLRPIVCSTGQHRAMLHQALRLFDVKADIDLDLMQVGQTPSEVLSQALAGLRRVMSDVQPSIVVAQGDTVTTLAASLAGYYAGVPVAHVEAGLRTGNLNEPFPEEGHRKLVAQLARLHFAPSPSAHLALVAEGVLAGRIFVTGNSGIDALLQMSRRMTTDPQLAAEVIKRFSFVDPGKPLILVTSHRRENLGERLASICTAVQRIADKERVEIVFPVHPNPRVQTVVYSKLAGRPNIHLVGPLDYHEFTWLLGICHIVLTDSGGVQEEAPALGRPVLVLRETTERQEAVAAGVARLVGTDPQVIVDAVHALLHDEAAYLEMARAVSPYGDGQAAPRIVELIERFLTGAALEEVTSFASVAERVLPAASVR